MKQIVFFILLLQCFIQFTSCQVLPQNEIDSAVWIIRQYGSTIAEDSNSICGSAVFECSAGNAHITHVYLRPVYTTFITNGLAPNTFTTISLPECLAFEIQPPGVFLRDPNQSVYTKLTGGLPKVVSIMIFDDRTSIFPSGLLEFFPSLTGATLSFGNVTVLNDNMLTVKRPLATASFVFNSLKTYPLFENGTNSFMTSLGAFSYYINVSATDAPLSINLKNSLFKQLASLTIGNNAKVNSGTITVTASFQSISLLAISPTGLYNLISPSPEISTQLRFEGKFTSVPTLDKFVNLVYLVSDYANPGDQYPFTVFPPKLQHMIRQFTTTTTLPTLPAPTANFQKWQYHRLTGITTVPWALMTPDNTSRLLDISNNPTIAGTVPPSSCINKLDITGTLISSLPDCYWCYFNDKSIIKTDLTLLPGFTCQPTIDQTLVYTKGFRGVLTGNLLGWGNEALHPTQGGYTLVPVVPQKMLTLYYQTNGLEQAVSIKLNENEAYTISFRIQEVGIILTSVNATQQLNQKVWFTWTFLFYNNNLQHQFTVSPSSRNCTIFQTQYNQALGSSIVSCELDINQLNTATYTFRVSNAYNLETFIVPFKYYPRLLSGQVDSTNQRLIYLFGDFRQNHSLANITINDKILCSVVSSAVDAINCTLSESASYGPANVSIFVDGYPYISNDFLYFTAPPNNNGSTTTSGGSTTTTTGSTTGGGGTTPQTQCQESTSNCFGHGSCDVNGRCQCDSGYNPIDNCLTKYTNTTPSANTTAPTSSFEIDGTKCDFELVAIQEIDPDGKVVGELMTNSWNASINNDNSTTLVNYQLVNITNRIYTGTIVKAMISFSTQPRDIQFGDQLLHINPNSIKLALNITNWQYSNLISTLRVVFRTDVNMNQTIEYECKQQPISTFSYDQLSSTIQYLRVIKDNIQYNGRFIDYVLSDGRPTFSKTTLINQTTSQSSPSPTTIMSTLIGVSLPQCQSCLLDPDFTPLLIDNSQSDCDSTNSKTWKIIVGVVVGGFAAIAISVGTVILYQKKAIFAKHNKMMSNRLAQMNNK
ncbi:hypothetical protein DFA_00692 [Cavenderia fasciculata]|uniref:EGF-like domain-containing protein n=1 Tax=Cavenderia fasciculata TaxID=261658 RepID=F4PT91_CACFS|nr:uncharacterized protein DFA_00692 [Cavenderia fasciculata]EGG20827.1 hypothetical protein DFA_00692 [Cavenderia fasciculata]|eukprot:XP_004358677.1 hypothetical protein DFA_00692 [Cavenderia fasciculata]